MKTLTFNSTFKDIRKLLESEDEYFKKQCVYLCGDEFNKETDQGYLRQNFHFFMAIVLGGVYYQQSYHKKFLDIAYPNRKNINTTSSWEQGVKNFIFGERSNLKDEFREGLKNLDENLSLNTLYNGSWIDWKDKNEKPIFKDENGTYIFKSKEQKISGEVRAKEKMKQIVEFLVGNKQIISNGGFSNMIDSYELLLANKQLIMNGAPGTGKTYSARHEIADKLLEITDKSEAEKDKIKMIQMDMIQFHPSYDYTDFIEGIRPTMKDGNVGYTLKNGSFKKFCRRAGVIERILMADKVVSEESIDTFLVGEDEEVRNFWKGYLKNNEENFKDANSKKIDIISKLPRFLFIIDEINRAEISKVLGETMFCLDADYRGDKGAIVTQYAALETEESFYINMKNDKFFIPSNVYIIGTMNDIDRSVEVFDFALRRRFAWHEVEAKAVMNTVLKAMGIDDLLGDANYKQYLEKIDSLNEAIEQLLKLNRHYHLGPSYFAKIKLYLGNGDYQTAKAEVWNNHLSQILNEYVKGKKTESVIKQIGDAFME